MLPELYTPKEIALKLKLFNGGRPNESFVKRLVNYGELDCIKISKNNIRITEKSLEDFVRRKTCQKGTKGRMLPKEQTEVGGELENLLTDKDIGSLAAAQASKRLRMNLSKSLSKEGKEE
jgi:hypothetical protein